MLHDFSFLSSVDIRVVHHRDDESMEKKEKKNLASAEIEKITVLFFEQHRRGRTSSQAYSKSWCKLSKRRAHTHTHTHANPGKQQPEKVEFVCMHDSYTRYLHVRPCS